MILIVKNSFAISNYGAKVRPSKSLNVTQLFKKLA
jgi:hypothetical protein